MTKRSMSPAPRRKAICELSGDETGDSSLRWWEVKRLWVIREVSNKRDARTIRRPGWLGVNSLVLGYSDLAGSVRVHDVDLGVAVPVANEGYSVAVRRPDGRGIQGSVVGETYRHRSVGIHAVDIPGSRRQLSGSLRNCARKQDGAQASNQAKIQCPNR